MGVERLLEGNEATSTGLWESPRVSKKEVLFFAFFFKLFLVVEVVACKASLVESFWKLEGAELFTTAGFMFR